MKVRENFDPIDADNATAVMEEKIRRSLLKKGFLSDRDLKRDTNAHRSGLWVYRMAIKNLREALELKWDRERKAFSLN